MELKGHTHSQFFLQAYIFYLHKTQVLCMKTLQISEDRWIENQADNRSQTGHWEECISLRAARTSKPWHDSQKSKTRLSKKRLSSKKQTNRQAKNKNKQTKQPSVLKPVYMKENFWLLRKTNFYQVNDKQILLIVKWRTVYQILNFIMMRPLELDEIPGFVTYSNIDSSHKIQNFRKKNQNILIRGGENIWTSEKLFWNSECILRNYFFLAICVHRKIKLSKNPAQISFLLEIVDS